MSLQPTERTALRRKPERGSFDREQLYAILDEALWCHVGFLRQGRPAVIPTIHARWGDDLVLHGSPASSTLRTIKGGMEVCVGVTLVDGVVLARSVFNSSLNYRSAIVYGTATEIIDADEKLAAMEALTEHVARGRWADARRPTEAEIKGTTMLGMPIIEASVKIRTGPPEDEPEDYELAIWAGVVPAAWTAGPPEADPGLAAGIAAPPYATSYRRPGT